MAVNVSFKRSPTVLWGFVSDLKLRGDCSLFFDLSIYCSDGAVSWNRLCLALSHPAYTFLMDINREDVAVSMVDCTMAEVKEWLKNSLGKDEEEDELEVVDEIKVEKEESVQDKTRFNVRGNTLLVSDGKEGLEDEDDINPFPLVSLSNTETRSSISTLKYITILHCIIICYIMYCTVL